MVMAFATLDEAWGIPEERSKTRVKAKAKPKSKSRMLENIMDVYTSDKHIAEVTRACKSTILPSLPSHDLLPGYISHDIEYAHFVTDESETREDFAVEEPPVSYHEPPPPAIDEEEVEQFVDLPQVPEVIEVRPVTPSALPEALPLNVITGQRPVEGAGFTPVVHPPPPVVTEDRENYYVYLWEMLIYILSGVLLIFMMEQLVKLGVSMRRV